MCKCSKIHAREFWLNGELVSPCCELFILLENGVCVTSSYNDETCEFEVFGITEVPDFKIPEGDSEFYYPYKELFPSIDITQIEFEKYEISKNQADFYFSNNISIKLVYDVKKDREIVKIST